MLLQAYEISLRVPKNIWGFHNVRLKYVEHFCLQLHHCQATVLKHVRLGGKVTQDTGSAITINNETVGETWADHPVADN